ncbi:MAG: hypothetical protein Q4C25_03040 [Bacillota bacterium]|nr:hypothetical protein [Bacillota bacterium]
MLELGNEAQVRSALEGKTGLGKEMESELIRRVAVTELEQDDDTVISPVNKGIFIGMVVISLIATVLLFI